MALPCMEDLRRFCGVDTDAEDTILKGCLDAAIDWYARSGVPPDCNSPLYAHWLCNLASWFYDNRGLSGANAVIPPYIVSSVWQLRGDDDPYAARARTTTNKAGCGGCCA